VTYNIPRRSYCVSAARAYTQSNLMVRGRASALAVQSTRAYVYC
jgi:hypothetical protein